MVAPNLPKGFDFTDPDIYADRLPVEEFAELRRTAPIWWNEQPPDVGGFGDGGFWVVSRHRDVREVSLHSDVFSSAQEVDRAALQGDRRRRTDRGGPGVDDHDGRSGAQPVAQDRVPRIHATRRRAATRRTRRAGPAHRRRGRRRQGSGDFVLQVARELPLQAIAGLLGVPLEDREQALRLDQQDDRRRRGPRVRGVQRAASRRPR